MKHLPPVLHQQIASFCVTAVECSLTTETGAMTFACIVTLTIWFKTISCIHSEEDARQYESYVDRLYQLVCEEDNTTVHSWWMVFWSIVMTKYPIVAVDHIPQFLHEVMDRKQTVFASFLPVSEHRRFRKQIVSS